MTSPPTGQPATGQGPGLAATVGLYALARLALVAVVTVLMLLAGTPFLIAVLVGLIVALPLSMVLFRGLRSRLDGALAESRSRRSAERAALRARLRGEGDAPESGEPGQRQPDPGEH
jgi:hypothetical protein